MKKCISLAKKGTGNTSPNPLVGCVVINSDDEIISTGYHKKYGEFHAERNALLKLNDCKNATLIVNLEPCSHQGKTPPCTDIIIQKGIKTVIYGMKDPNPKVCGTGLNKLKDAGIEIIGPVMEDECKKLNSIFIKNITKKLPYIAIKTATTIDGKIGTSTKDSKWITGEKSRKYSYKLRKIYDAILTSSTTIMADNPTMKHKKKIILDRNLRTNTNYNIYKNGDIYVFYDENLPSPENTKNIHYIKCPVIDNKLDIEFIINKIFELGIMSVFVECGGTLAGNILPHADKIYHFIAPKVLNDNSGLSCFDGDKVEFIKNCKNLKLISSKNIGDDILLTYII